MLPSGFRLVAAGEVPGDGDSELREPLEDDGVAGTEFLRRQESAQRIVDVWVGAGLVEDEVAVAHRLHHARADGRGSRPPGRGEWYSAPAVKWRTQLPAPSFSMMSSVPSPSCMSQSRMPTRRTSPSSRSAQAVTMRPLKVQKPWALAWPAWWKPETGATAAAPDLSAWRAAASIAPLVYGSEAATRGERVRKPFRARQARMSSTWRRSWARQSWAGVTGAGSRISDRQPEEFPGGDDLRGLVGARRAALARGGHLGGEEDGEQRGGVRSWSCLDCRENLDASSSVRLQARLPFADELFQVPLVGPGVRWGARVPSVPYGEQTARSAPSRPAKTSTRSFATSGGRSSGQAPPFRTSSAPARADLPGGALERGDLLEGVLHAVVVRPEALHVVAEGHVGQVSSSTDTSLLGWVARRGEEARR